MELLWSLWVVWETEPRKGMPRQGTRVPPPSVSGEPATARESAVPCKERAPKDRVNNKWYIVCMYISIYVYMYMCMWIYIYICICADSMWAILYIVYGRWYIDRRIQRNLSLCEILLITWTFGPLMGVWPRFLTWELPNLGGG